MAEGHSFWKPGNFRGFGPETVEKQRVAQRILCRAEQNEMRGVLDRMTTGTA